MIDYLATFIFFFAVIDPIGTVPVFIAVTRGFDEPTKRAVAFKAAAAAACTLVFFVVAGELLLTALDIPLSAFRVAGGIVLFLFALTMIFGESKPEEEVQLVENRADAAIYPLAVPSIASPGAILAAVLLTENSRYSLWQQGQTTLVMLGVVGFALLLMLLAVRIHRLIGDGGASLISRVMGLILASVATASTLAGIREYFSA